MYYFYPSIIPMSGETNLSILLQSLQPQLHKGVYVFCTIPEHHPIPVDKVLFFFREEEGTSLILTQENAESLSIPYSYAAAWISLQVHSSLEAVGLTAAFSHALTQAGISCNVVAGYYHDHIFVAYSQANAAMEVLNALRK